MPTSPFKFLDSYTRDDRHIFFGRDREIEELYHRVFESKIMLVYGVSGTGKSSLINCGLANKFQETDWLPINIRRGGDIVKSFVHALEGAAITPLNIKNETPAQFKKAIQSLYLDHYKPVYFIFDQFEELFIFGNREERKAFGQIIKTLDTSELQCRFLFVLREEYLAGVTEFEKSIPDFLANRVRIEKMSHINARQAIEGPCNQFGISLEEGFSGELLETLYPNDAEVELTYLQVFLDKLFRMSDGDKKGKSISFSKSLLQQTGNVTDILGSFLDEQIALLDDPDTSLAVLKSFVSVKGTKRQMSPEEIQDYAHTLGKPIEGIALQELIQTFIHLRILRDKDQNNRYELRHDALAEKIYEKITLVEKELLEIRQLIENAYHNWQKRGVLISSDDLNYIAPYESKLFLSHFLDEFIEVSKKETHRKKTRNRNMVLAGTFLLCFVLSFLSVTALLARKKAEIQKLNAIQKKNESNSNLYASYSFIQLNNNPTLSFRLAEKALEIDNQSISALKAVLGSYYSAPFYSIIAEYDNELNFLKLSPENNLIITVPFRSDNLNIWDTKGNKIVDFITKNRSISNVSISPDENLIVTSGQDCSLRIFDLHGNPMARLSGRENEYDYLSSEFSNDGKTIATGDSKTIKILDLKGNILKALAEYECYPYSIALTTDGKFLVWGAIDRFGIWDLTMNTKKTFIYNMKSIVYVAISSDNKYILSSAISNESYYSNDSTAILWNLKGEKIRTFTATNKVSCVSFSPPIDNIAIADLDGKLKIFNKNGELLQSINTNQNGIDQIKFTRDGNYIYTVSNNSRNILFWNMKSKVPERISGHKAKISSIEYSPDGRYILTSSYDSTAILWTFEGKFINVFKGHKGKVNSAQFSSDSRMIITSGNDNAAIVWDLKGNILLNYKFDDYPVEFAGFSPDNSKIILISPANIIRTIDFKGNTISENRWKYDYSWNVGGGGWWPRKLLIDSLGNEVKYDNWHKSYINSAEFSSDGKFVLTAGDDSTAKVWDLNGNEKINLKGHNNRVIDASFSGNGEIMVTATIDNTLRIWSKKGELLTIIKGPIECLRYANFSDDNKYIFTQSQDDTCRQYDLKGNLKYKDFWERIYISSAYFSPDGNKILTASRDGLAKLWDTKTNKFVELGESYYASFSPDGKIIATISDWDHISLWDYFGNKLISFPSQDEQINSVKFSSNGRFILTSCADNTAKLWDLNGNEIHTFIGSGKNITYASFSPDGKHIAIANDDKSFQIWLIDPFDIVRNVNENSDTIGVWKLNTTAKKRYNIDLDFFETVLENAQLNFLKANTEFDTIQKIKFLNKAIKNFDYIVETAKDSLDQNELIKVKNEQSDVYLELAIISLYRREFASVIENTQKGLICNPNNGLLTVYKAISLLFDNQFDKSREIVLLLKNKPVETGNEEYNEVILKIINNLENSGITNSDFEKVKKMIKEK